MPIPWNYMHTCQKPVGVNQCVIQLGLCWLLGLLVRPTWNWEDVNMFQKEQKTGPKKGWIVSPGITKYCPRGPWYGSKQKCLQCCKPIGKCWSGTLVSVKTGDSYTKQKLLWISRRVMWETLGSNGLAEIVNATYGNAALDMSPQVDNGYQEFTWASRTVTRAVVIAIRWSELGPLSGTSGTSKNIPNPTAVITSIGNIIFQNHEWEFLRNVICTRICTVVTSGQLNECGRRTLHRSRISAFLSLRSWQCRMIDSPDVSPSG
jgi:hypothetical protein